jgi:hypothetical protein
MSVTAEGATITDITYYGTSAEVADSGGFASVELTTGAGNEGAVEAIVLSFKKPITYPVNGTDTMAIIQVASAIPAGGGSFTLLYKDNLQGAGEPVPNNVTQGGETRTPVLTDKVVELRLPPPCCAQDPLNFGFSEANITGAAPWEGIAGAEAEGCGNQGMGGTISIETALGDLPSTHVFANVISQNPTTIPEGETEPVVAGVQGWSVSVGVTSGDATLVSATYAGTVAAQAESGGFASVELVDPAANAGVTSGAVEAIVLSFKKPITLPVLGTESVLDLEVKGTVPQAATPASAVLKFVDDLRGSGEPVPNSLTVGGETAKACNQKGANQVDVTLSFGVTTERFFLGGNANNDAKVDIADAVYIINALLRQGPPMSCLAAGDINGDSFVDASDAVYLINYLFKSGPAPSASFPECSTADPALCDADQQVCK